MIKKFFDNFEEILGSSLVALMVSISFLNVITRYFIKMSLSWSEEITVNLFVWVVLLGTAVAFKQGSHLGMSFVYDRLPAGVRKILFVLSVILCVTFFSTLGYMGYTEVLDEISLEVTTESLAIPVWYYTTAVPVFSGLVVFRILQNMFQVLRDKSY